MESDFRNRAARRYDAAIKRRPARLPGMGVGKHALNGNKFRFIRSNAFKTVIKQMKYCPMVTDKILSGELDKYFE